MLRFAHFNFNVLDLDKSLAFYRDALELSPVRTKEAADGSFKLVYLGDGETGFELELTWLKDRTEPYDLGGVRVPPGLCHRPLRRALPPPQGYGLRLL